jgi:glyoxylase-like metal-dependent hydrolase (beta-lactamase superfamily II)
MWKHLNSAFKRLSLFLGNLLFYQLMTIELLHLSNPYQPQLIHPVLLRTNTAAYLVDCGYAANFDQLCAELSRLGVTIQQLTAVVISHDDIDHLGGLASLKNLRADLPVVCSETEAPSVAGLVASERLLQARAKLPSMPTAEREFGLQFIEALSQIRRFPVNRTLKDGDYLLPDLRVVATPGHTQGHVSFFEEKSRTLIACDALVLEDGKLNIANPQFTLDLPEALRSVRRIAALQPEIIFCYHGGIIETNIAAQLEYLLLQYNA